MSDPVRAFEAAENELAIRRARRELNPRQRKALERRFWYQDSLAEVGRNMGISENAAKQLVHRAVIGVAKCVGLDLTGMSGNCREDFFEDLLTSARGGTLPSKRQAEVTAHLELCEMCSQAQEALGETKRGLRAIMPPLLGVPALRAQLEQALSGTDYWQSRSRRAFNGVKRRLSEASASQVAVVAVAVAVTAVVVLPVTDRLNIPGVDPLVRPITRIPGIDVLIDPRGGAVASAAPGPLDFGDQDVGIPVTKVITIKNSGDKGLTLSGAALNGANTTHFGIDSSDCNTTLKANNQCSIRVKFAPLSEGSSSAAVAFTHNGAGPTRVDLFGRASVPDLAGTWSVAIGQKARDGFVPAPPRVERWTFAVQPRCATRPCGYDVSTDDGRRIVFRPEGDAYVAKVSGWFANCVDANNHSIVTVRNGSTLVDGTYRLTLSAAEGVFGQRTAARFEVSMKETYRANATGRAQCVPESTVEYKGEAERVN